MAPAKREILQICENFPLVLLFGPKSKLGLGLKHLYPLQGILHIEDLIHQTSRGTLAGELYRSTLEQLLVNIGYGNDLFSASCATLGKLMPYTWMAHLWEFLDRHGLQLHHDIKMEMLRHHDCFIMRNAVEAKFIFSQLDTINRCCLYLQVITLAEIVTADGESITEKAWAGTYDSTVTSPYKFPRQPRPPSRDWGVWRTALNVCFISTGRRTRQPLGHWLQNDAKWDWLK